MGLFNKKLSLEEILKSIEALSEEEKAELIAKMQEGETTEEAETVEETSTEETNEGEEVVEETEEVTEAPAEEVPTEEAPTEEVVEETPAEAPVEETVDATPTEPEQGLNQVEENNQADVMQQFTDRLSALEEKLASFEELKARMEEYTQKQADKLGYKGSIPSGKKDYKDMSADELSRELRTEI